MSMHRQALSSTGLRKPVVPRCPRLAHTTDWIHHQWMVCGAGFDPNPTPPKKRKEETTIKPAETVDLDDSEIERRLMQRKLRRKTKDTKSEDGAFKVNTESVPDAVNTDLETTVIYVLTTLFGLILLNGLVLAAAGFLPKEVDSFAEKILYPSFTPVVLVFLACSTAYGVWKTREDKESDS